MIRCLYLRSLSRWLNFFASTDDFALIKSMINLIKFFSELERDTKRNLKKCHSFCRFSLQLWKWLTCAKRIQRGPTKFSVEYGLPKQFISYIPWQFPCNWQANIALHRSWVMLSEIENMCRPTKLPKKGSKKTTNQRWPISMVVGLNPLKVVLDTWPKVVRKVDVRFFMGMAKRNLYCF